MAVWVWRVTINQVHIFCSRTVFTRNNFKKIEESTVLCSPGQPVLIYRLSTKYSFYVVLDNCDLFHKARGIEWSGIEMLQDERCFFLCKLR